MFDQPSVKGVEELTKTLMGDEYNGEHFDKLADSAGKMASRKNDYLPSKKSLFEELRSHNPEAVCVLSGSHSEVITSVNLVEGTTFDSSRFSSYFEDKLQVFNFDVWYSKNLAQLIAPKDKQLQSIYLHARMALAAGTLMLLTDGSLPTVVRLSKT